MAVAFALGWYIFTLLAGIIWLSGTPSLRSRLTVAETVVGGIVIGTCASTWIVYLVACMLSSLT